jgi:lipoprotein-anchoring transpeptidase ErfK/SrfK
MARRAFIWILAALGVAALAGVGGYALGPVRAAFAERGPAAAVAATSPTSATPETGSPASAAAAEPAQPAATAPSTAPATTPAASSVPPAGGVTGAACPEGDRQREVEASLAQLADYASVTVDGKQSPQDCSAIKKFQTRYGISPAQGRAGASTANVARRIAASVTTAERAKCSADRSALTVCVDLTQQTVWAVRDGAVVWGPTVVRTGKAGFQTPTGTYRIVGRESRAWSVPYKVWMPYWQAFNGGIGFHETTTYIHDASIGSHGCVNLLRADAQSLWKLTSVGTTVTVFGRRPGT